MTPAFHYTLLRAGCDGHLRDHADDGSTGQVTAAIRFPTIDASTVVSTSRIYGRDHELPGYA